MSAVADRAVRAATDMAAADVVLFEGVWAPPFARLQERYALTRSDAAPQDSEAFAAAVGSARAVVVRNRTRVTGEALAAAAGLEVVGRMGVGLDNVDVGAADARGVVVVASRGANAGSVAEHAVGAALALAKGLVDHDRAVRAGTWARRPGRDLAGRTWGVVGGGATARATARLAAALGMPVVGYDPYVPAPVLRDAGIEPVPTLAALASRSDVVSVHLPATPETAGVIDAAFLRRLPRGALLVNVARGEVVDEAALAAALAGHLGGAALDVRATEPPPPGGLEQLPNVLSTPHVAGLTVESQERIATILTDDLTAVLEGGTAAHAAGAVAAAGARPGPGPGAPGPEAPAR